MERENDIIKDSYYLINLFHKENRIITQLHIQKLMFLFESYYMSVTNEDKLYECGYKAWNFGPVAPRLYKMYKDYGKDDIRITKEEQEEGNQISEQKKKLMKELYNTFKDFSAMELVSFTHAKGSPWKEVWENNPYGDISKESMKDWFRQYVKKS